MIQKQEIGKQILGQAVLICFCVYFLMCDILQPTVPWKWWSEYLALEHMLCFSFLGLILVSLPNASRKRSLSYLAFFWVWMILIRMAIQGLDKALFSEIFSVGVLCVVFYLTTALDAKGKQRLGDVFCGILFPILTVWGILGFLVCINVIPEVRIGDAAIALIVHPYGSGKAIYVFFFGVNKNITATWFMVAFWLAVVQFFRTHRKWLRVLLGLFGGLMYVTVGLQCCRFVNIAFAVGAGMLVVLLAKDRLKIQRTAARRLAVGLIAVVVMFGCYKGFDFCGQVANKIAGPDALKNAHPAGYMPVWETEEEPDQTETESETVAETEAETAAETVAETAAEAVAETEAETVAETEPETVTEAETETTPESETLPGFVGDSNGVGDTRNFFKDMLTLTGRTPIWASSLRAVFTRKKFMLLGQPVDDIPMNMIHYGGYEKFQVHTHNMLIQVLAQGGIIGLVLMTAFTYLQIRTAIRLFFSRKQSLSRKIYAILLVCLLINGIGEPILNFEFTARAFMFTAGMLADQEEPTDFRKIFRFRKKKA